MFVCEMFVIHFKDDVVGVGVSYACLLVVTWYVSEICGCMCAAWVSGLGCSCDFVVIGVLK